MINSQRVCIGAIVGVLVLLCTGCGRSPVEPLPSMENLKFHGLSREALPDPGSQGARLVGRYCSQCHDIPDPATHTADRWIPSVAEMVRYMNLPSGRKAMKQPGAPSSEEADRIVAYLKTHAHTGLNMEAYKAALASEEGRDFRETCDQCHGLPDPRQHTADEWPWVVKRMRKNMRYKEIQPPDEAATARIIDFLQKYAAR
jgi:cytochrome c5